MQVVSGGSGLANRTIGSSGYDPSGGTYASSAPTDGYGLDSGLCGRTLNYPNYGFMVSKFNYTPTSANNGTYVIDFHLQSGKTIKIKIILALP